MKDCLNKLKSCTEKLPVNKILMYVSVILFCIITVNNLINHVPWFDETQAWILSKDMNIQNVISILKSEGHFIVWYLLIMPFAKLNLWYPLSMQIVNWLCFFLAILVMWTKAPFNVFAKMIITFSWVSLNYYSVVARCYSVGILGLFILAALYKKQLEKPILYSLLLVFTAHTSLAGTMAVIPLALIFMYNLIKDRKEILYQNIVIATSIICIGVILWVTPFINGYGHPEMLPPDIKIWESCISFFRANHYSLLIYYTVTLVILFISADAKIKFFLLMTTAQFFIFHSIIYPAYAHNAIFAFIYIIVAYWLIPEIHTFKEKPFVVTVFLLFFAALMFADLGNKMWYALNNIDKSDLVAYINNRPNKDYIFMNWDFAEILPYLDSKYKYIYISPEYDRNCIKKASCAKEEIKKQLKDVEGWNACLVTSEKVDENSVLFRWERKGNFPAEWYVTEFGKN